MNEQDDEWKFLDSVRAELDQSVQDIDAQTLSRLAQIRYQALEHVPGNRLKKYFLPAGVFATACLIFATITFFPQQQAEPEEMAEDIDMISSAESLDLYEDLEFYEWLEDYVLPT